MKLKTVFFSLLLIVCASQVCFSDNAITLKPGQEVFRKLDSIKRISVADPIIADAKVLTGGQQLMIRALKPGDTTVTVFDEQERKTTFHITVLSMMSGEAKKVQDLLTEVETVSVRVIDDQVVVEGTIIREKDRKPLIKVKELFKNVKFLVEDNVKKNQEYIIEAIESELPSTISAKLLGDGVMLEGTVASSDEKSEAEKIAKQFVDNVYSVLKVQEVSIAVIVNPIEFVMEEEDSSSSMKVLKEGLKIENGLFGFSMADEMAADDLVQDLNNLCVGTSAFEGQKDYQKNGQYEISLENGEKLYIFFQFDVIRKDLFKVSVSLLDGKKKVLNRNEFFAKKNETIGVSGVYNTLRGRKKNVEKDKELVIIFDLKN